ncbi:MAG: DUF1573 domain-containing protein, partial [Chitinophagaceae bacterium]
MKKMILVMAVLLMAITTYSDAQAVEPASATTVPVKSPFEGKVKFQNESVNFGTTQYNKPVTVNFTFTNIGNQPLIVENAQPSCGCTNPSWPKAPILPGQSGTISATYSANMV